MKSRSSYDTPLGYAITRYRRRITARRLARAAFETALALLHFLARRSPPR